MRRIIKLALTLDLAATWCGHMVPKTKAVLPLGGDHFTQLAAIVIVAIVICELFALFASEKTEE
jgi:hypothetical protein